MSRLGRNFEVFGCPFLGAAEELSSSILEIGRQIELSNSTVRSGDVTDREVA